MRPRAVLPLVILPLLAGCAFPGSGGGDAGDESVRGPDRSAYTGGTGLAIAIENDGEDPFRFEVRVLDANGTERARAEGDVAPGEVAETWWTLDGTRYNVTMDYQWKGGEGSFRNGDDEREVDLGGCPAVTRVAWRLVQTQETVGAAFLGGSCAQA